MPHAPFHEEIDHRTIKLMIGVVALALAPLTSALSPAPIDSISAAYYAGGAAQNVLVGFLFAIAVLLLAYNGRSYAEMWLSKLAALAALGVALFPCTCGSHAVHPPWVHGTSATLMFLILVWFCLTFHRRARTKRHAQARVRATLYAACGATIVLAIGVLGLNALLGGVWQHAAPHLVLYGEAVSLTAFGIAWLTASHALPGLNHPNERFAPWREQNPP